MDELTKYSMRNNLSAVAYLLLAIMGISFTIVGLTGVTPNIHLVLFIEILIGAAGLTLLILKKRDLTALCFLMFALMFGYYTVTGGLLRSIIVPVMLFLFILFGIFLLATKEPKKTTYFCIFFPYGIGAICIALFRHLTIISAIMHILFSLIALLYAIIFASEKIHLPLAKNLKSDEAIEFRKVGPVLGYYPFAIFCVITAVNFITGLVDGETFKSILLVCGIVLTMAGIINAIFAQQKFMPLMFILMGIAIALIPLGGSVFYFVAGGVFILLFILALLQKESRLLPAAMLILSGALFFIMGFGLFAPVFGVILAGLTGLLAFYITFALLDEKKPVPLF